MSRDLKALRAGARTLGWLAARRVALTLARALPRREAPTPGAVLAVAPASPGSLGDAAMMRVVASACQGGPRPGFVGFRGDDVWEGFDGPPAAVVSAVGDATGWRDAVRALDRFEELWIVGADILDGRYGDAIALRALLLAEVGVARGCATKILGSSLNASPTPTVRAQLGRMSPAVRVCARDPVSAGRLAEHLGRAPRQVADLAFLLAPEPGPASRAAAAWVEAQRSQGRAVIGVDFNARAFAGVRGAGDTEAVVRTCVGALESLAEAREVAFALVAHDVRGPASDAILAERIAARLADRWPDRVHRVPATASAGEIKHLAGALDLAISGRMHFAIACLGVGVPVLALPYQGKFAGLYDLLGLDRARHLQPAILDAPEAIARAAATLLDARADSAAVLLRELPRIRALARDNFA